ncbi:MAG: hypothetical protein M3R46_05955, partial [Actinomycetota bacterium]|nr:hypothetical protein [Actinomycetota bacterium]
VRGYAWCPWSQCAPREAVGRLTGPTLHRIARLAYGPAVHATAATVDIPAVGPARGPVWPRRRGRTA